MANEKRLIDANAVAQEVRKNNRENFTRRDWTSKNVCTLLEYAPTVDAVEVVHGKWEFACVHNGKKHYKCTNCHHAFPFANVNYCPNCGAKMRGNDE